MLRITWWLVLRSAGSRRHYLLTSRSRHPICLSDWSSDVCSSDLLAPKSCGYGRFPVTVFMDRRHYTGHARGYDVRLFDTRLWHAKAIMLMTGTQRDPRTIFLCG